MKAIFQNVKKKKRPYDALVPLSGGKDSIYVLYLAKKIYNLNVLAYTFDNGLMNDLALKNIESALKKTGADHVVHRPSWETLGKLYKASLLYSGELCSACGIRIVNGYLKLSADWRIPLILVGGSQMEVNSGPPEQIYDINRFKTIVSNAANVSGEELERFLIFPSLSPVQSSIYSIMGRFGRVVNLLWAIPKQSEEEVGAIITREMDWQDGGKHSDCLAEPFSNLIRENRFGYSRRVCQYSNLIRIGELTREAALDLIEKESFKKNTERVGQILEKLELSRDDLETIMKVKPCQFERYCYKQNFTLKILRSIEKVCNKIRY